MTGPNPAMPPVDAVVCLVTQGNLTEEMARLRLQPELQSPDGNIPSGPDMKAAALWYAKHGIAVFPLHWPMEGRCSCGEQDCHACGKHPLTPNGFKDATTDQARISEWWSKWPDANIGMPTGAAPGLLVVDVDPRNGGDESLDELLAKYGAFPNTAEQLTGGGGLHIVLRYFGGPVPKTLAPGIDLKGDGGYIVVAPSLHLSGKRYHWEGIEGPEALLHPAELPTWLLHYITGGKRAEELHGTIPYELPEIIPDGEKHNAIVSLIGTLMKRGVPREAAFAACRELNFENHVSDADIWERVDSCYKLYQQTGDARELYHCAASAVAADPRHRGRTSYFQGVPADAGRASERQLRHSTIVKKMQSIARRAELNW